MNNETSITNKNIIWEEKNLTEPPMKLENNGVLDECGIITNINNLKEKEHSTDTIKISGIYKIVNRVNGKYYVGSSNNIKKRWSKHKNDLNKNIHNNKYLQRSWNKYGKDNFDFIILEKISPTNLLSKEQSYLNICKNDKNKYNIAYSSTAPMLGKNHTQDAKKKMSICKKGKPGIPKSLESKIKQSNSMKGKYLGCNHPLFGKHHTQETKEKIKIANSKTYEEIYGIEKANKKRIIQSNMWSGSNNPMYNKHHTLDTKLKLANYRIGKKHSNETKEKIGKYSRDNTQFSLKNTKTHEIFVGTKHEFIVKYNSGKRNYSIYCIFNKNKPYKGWILNI